MIASVLAATSTPVRAEPKLPSEVVAKATAYDWAMYRGDGPARALGMVSKRKRMYWFRGDQDSEWKHDQATMSPYALLTDAREGSVTNLKTVAATCKLATTVPCTKVTFTVPDPGNTKNTLSVTLLLSERVRATGLVELEIKGGAVVTRATLVGHGGGTKTEWGQAPTTKQLAYLSGWVGAEQLRTEPGDTIGPATLASITASGGGDLDVATIRRYIKKTLAKSTSCYEKEQLARPKLEGIVQVSFDVGADGKVTKPTAKGFDATVDTCIAAAQPTELPKPKNGKPMTVVYEITFDPPQRPMPKPPTAGGR